MNPGRSFLKISFIVFYVSAFAFILSCAFCGSVSAAGEKYDPLAVVAENKPQTVPLNVADASRSRDIPLLAYLPKDTAPAPLVLFSHGLGGSNAGCAYLGEHWARRGYAAVFIQHPGSDTSVWKGKALAGRKEALEEAASMKNFILRIKDVPAVLDALEKWNKTSGHDLCGRLDTGRIGMSGHSFGALTTQAVSGQSYRLGGQNFTDPRIGAAVMFSPSSPRRGGVSAEKSFGGVKIPWLLMTGTKDVAAIGNTDLESRLAVFPALPPGNKYEIVLFEAEHLAFSDRAIAGSSSKRNPNHHRVILGLSTAFWDAYLRGDTAAKAWLDGTGPQTVIEKNDRWQKK